ncbi:hypothetical protein BGZ63DRAFT_451659 [Mariannaea sp. PMI_226]|nr:hypothetical protein BGZ63DRAFT_451659 [Mariannaea sp. PMI_226]
MMFKSLVLCLAAVAVAAPTYPVKNDYPVKGDVSGKGDYSVKGDHSDKGDYSVKAHVPHDDDDDYKVHVGYEDDEDDDEDDDHYSGDKDHHYSDDDDEDYGSGDHGHHSGKGNHHTGKGDHSTTSNTSGDVCGNGNTVHCCDSETAKKLTNTGLIPIGLDLENLLGQCNEVTVAVLGVAVPVKSQCSQQTVCCGKSQQNGLVNLGCTNVNL